jgi:hypothetical protein
MASELNPIPPMPPPQQRIVEANGTPNRDWYLYQKRVDEHIREMEKRLTAGGL